MKERRKALSHKFGSRAAKLRRRRLLQQLNAMDVDIADHADDADAPMPQVLSNPFGGQNHMEVDDSSQPVFATRTKPVDSNKYKKRLGAKTAKKLELSENSAFELSPADATMYRALAARCNYLSQDRPDIAFSSKELCREFSVPNKSSFQKLKRLARYLAGLPRLVYMHP